MTVELKNGMRVWDLWGGYRTIVWRDGTWAALDDYGDVCATGYDCIRSGFESGLYRLVSYAPSPKKAAVNPADWLNSLSSEERKEVAVSRGLYAYFPDALALIARHSVRANEKHNPGQPVHWSREKSSDHEDCIARHSLSVAIDPDSLDGDAPHILCRAWRSLAALQLWIEAKRAKGEAV